MSTQPLSSAQYLSQVQSNAKPLPVNKSVPGLLTSLAPKAPTLPSGPQSMIPTASVGVKTKSPQDNIKTPTNTTPQPQVQKPASAPSSTENGTQNTGTYYNPNAGMQAVTGTSPTPSPQSQPIVSAQAPAPTGYQPNDNGLYGKLVTDLANRSQTSGADYQKIRDEQTALSKDYAQKTNNIAGTAGFLTQQSGLQGQLNNQYNTVQNTLASELSGANTQQGLMQQALSSATGAAAPQAYSATTMPYNPTSDTYGGGGVDGAMDRSIRAANINSAGQFATDYNTGKAKLDAASRIEDQIVGTLNSNPTLNNTPVSAFTDLARFFAGQASQPDQQALSQQVANYIQTLGLDPASVANTASQSRGTLGQLLKSLQQTAQAQVESKNPANLKTNTSTTSSTSTANPWH